MNLYPILFPPSLLQNGDDPPKFSVINKSNISKRRGVRSWPRLTQHFNPIKAKVGPANRGQAVSLASEKEEV